MPTNHLILCRLLLLLPSVFPSIRVFSHELALCIYISLMPHHFRITGASQVALVVKNPSANAGDIRDVGSIPGSGRCPGFEKHGNPLQYSCLENRGAWRNTIHGSHTVIHNTKFTILTIFKPRVISTPFIIPCNHHHFPQLFIL